MGSIGYYVSSQLLRSLQVAVKGIEGAHEDHCLVAPVVRLGHGRRRRRGLLASGGGVRRRRRGLLCRPKETGQSQPQQDADHRAQQRTPKNPFAPVSHGGPPSGSCPTLQPGGLTRPPPRR